MRTRLLIAFVLAVFLALLTTVRQPTLAGNNVAPGTWNMERLSGDNVWTQCSQGMSGGNVRTLALSPGYITDHTLFAGTWDDGAFKSTDGGASWNAVNNGLVGWWTCEIEVLAISPGYATDLTIFAGAYTCGISKSTDGGASWHDVTGTGPYYDVRSLALSPGYTTDSTLFVGSCQYHPAWGGVFKSTDGGASWSNMGLTDVDVNALALSPGYVNDHTLFAGTSAGVFKSIDGGASWHYMTGMGYQYVWALALSPGYANDSTLFAGTYDGGVFKSTDGGASWSTVNTGLTNLYVGALAPSPGYPTDHTLFAGTGGGGVFKSTDGGASWSAMNEGLGNLSIGSLALTPTSPRTLFAGTNGSGVWQYTFVSPTPTPTPLPDFTVTAIEVTQAIQDLENHVPLVAGKQTFARVHVRNLGASSSALVKARLCGPGYCLDSGSGIQVLANPDRAILNQSFYFELPPEWLNMSLILTAEVNPAGPQHVEESSTANNSLPQAVPFEPVPPLKVKLFGVKYRTLPFFWQVHEPRPEDYDLILSWLRRAYPISEIPWSPPGVINYGLGLPNCNKVNEKLLATWQFDRDNGKIDDQTHYYGIVYDDGGFMRGCAMDVPSTIASGPAGTPGLNANPCNASSWDFDGSYGDWYAGHELAHTYGRWGANFCGSVEPSGPSPYPYPDGIIGGPVGNTDHYYGFDIETTTVYTPTGWHDVMTYCPYQWISDVTYRVIRDHLVAQGALAAQKLTSAGEHLIVLGVVNHTQNTAELHTLYRIPDVTAPAPPVSGTHRLKLIGAGNAVLADYPFTPGKDTSTQPGEDQMGLIGETVPWVTGTQRVAVYSGTLELASRLVSTNAPTVTVLSPNGGEVFTDTAVLSWSADDADQDPLTYVLQYSADDGATWQAVDVGITGTTVYTLDLTLLPGSDQGRVRVIASDGVNTGMDSSDGAFRVAGKPPQAHILSPATGSWFLPAQMLILVGEGTDVEDGTLADSALSWQSSLSGTLGTGRMLAVAGLIGGTHVITLTATDSDGNTATATINVFVGYKTYLPLILRNY